MTPQEEDEFLKKQRTNLIALVRGYVNRDVVEFPVGMEEQLKAVIIEVLSRRGFAEGLPKFESTRPAPANDMEHFYVRGIAVMLIPDVMARINAPSQKHADKIEKYLHDEGFMPEPPEDEDEEEEESWK